jgi:hypothetical protein
MIKIGNYFDFWRKLLIVVINLLMQIFSQRRRLWQFLEDELKTTWMATANYQHNLKRLVGYWM